MSLRFVPNDHFFVILFIKVGGLLLGDKPSLEPRSRVSDSLSRLVMNFFVPLSLVLLLPVAFDFLGSFFFG